jgi:hypothetical protein
VASRAELPPPPECELAKLARRRRTGRPRDFPVAVHRRLLRDRISDPKPPIRSAFRIASRRRPLEEQGLGIVHMFLEKSRIIFRILYLTDPRKCP